MEENTNDPKPIRKGYGVPIAIVLLSALVLVVLNTQFDSLNESLNLNPGVRGISNFAIPALASVLCGLFLIFFRRGGWRTWIGLAFVATPFLIATVIQPVFDGDGQIVRTQFRFQDQLRNWRSAETETTAVDLKTTTDYDYPRFLGPDANATVEGLQLSDWKNVQPQVLWKQPIGDGWSGFAAVNGHAVTQEQRGDEECVTCYDIDTGTAGWISSAKRRHEDLTGMGKPGPRATPTIDDGKVYAMSATGILECLSGSDGAVIWSANIPKLVGIDQRYSTNSTGQTYSEETSTLAWGRATSPLIYEDLVIVPGGRGTAAAPPSTSATENGQNNTDNTNDAATLLAFDKQTGELRWRGGDRMIAYGSPIVTLIHGRPQIVLIAEDHAVGHDPITGEELWNFPRPGNSNMAANCSQVTPIADNQLVFSKGYGEGGELVEILRDTASGNYSVKSIRKDPRILKTKLTSPIVHRSHLFSLSDGYLECVAIEGLKRKWKKRGRFGNGQILLVGDKLLVHSESGVLYLVEANPESFIEIGKMKTIEGVCWNTLCLYKDLLLVRSELEAACIQLPLVDGLPTAAITPTPLSTPTPTPSGT